MISAPFYMADIKEVHLDDSVREIPDYLFANAHFAMKEFVIDRAKVGIMAFYNVWDTISFITGTDMVEKLTITEDVKFIGQEAFAQNWIKVLQRLSRICLLTRSLWKALILLWICLWEIMHSTLHCPDITVL